MKWSPLTLFVAGAVLLVLAYRTRVAPDDVSPLGVFKRASKWGAAVAGIGGILVAIRIWLSE